MKNNIYQNSEQDRRIAILEGHIETLNREMGDIKINVIKISGDVCWLKKFFFIVATASIGSLLATLIGLLLKK